MAHELAHMNTYNEGILGEETSLHTRKQVGKENQEKSMSEKAKLEYLAEIDKSYETNLRNVGINNPFERINSQRSIPGKNILVPFEESEK